MMFRWIRRRLLGDYSIYYPHQMKIYTYWNGWKWIKADPMVLYKKLMEAGPVLANDIQVANSPLVKNEVSIKANDNVVRKVRDIFCVPPIEAGGLTETAVAALLDHFLIYTETLKKNSRSLQTSLPPEVSAIISRSQTTPPSSESGSTADDSSTDKPEQSPTEQPSPSESSNPEWNTSEASPTANPKQCV